MLMCQAVPLHAKQRVRKVLVVVGVGQLAACLVLVWPHFTQTVVGLIRRQVLKFRIKKFNLNFSIGFDKEF